MKQSVNFIELISRGKIPEVMVGTWIVMGLLLIFGFFARRALRRAKDPVIPQGGAFLSLCEILVEWVDGAVHDVTKQHNYRRLVPFFGCLFVFILTANFFGMIPGMEPPTGNSDLTFGLASIVFVFYIVQGVRAQGILKYLASFLGPLILLAPLMLPIELADNLFRPFSLGLRLYANMFADHTVLGIFTGLVRLVLPVAFYALGAIVCVIQALIFMILSVSYVRIVSGTGH